MAYSVFQGHAEDTVKSTITKIRKMERLEARRKKEQIVNKSTAIYSVKCYPRVQNAIASILNNHIILAKLFLQYSIFRDNKTANYLRYLSVRVYLYILK